MKKYLKNSICNFKVLFEINYEKKKNIFSACFFKLDGKSYKNFNIYLNGIQLFSKYILKNKSDYIIRLFIDKSIYNDKKIMNILKKLKNVELVLYDCPNYKISNNKHIGLFGTLVRFFPIFNFKNNDSNIVLITDIDWKNEKDIDTYFELIFNKNINNIKKKLNILIIGRLFHICLKNKYIYNNKIFPYILAWKFINYKRLDKKILINYFKDINNNNSNKKFSNYNNLRKTKNKKYIFGIDEYFLNHNLKKYLVVNNKTFGVKFKYTITDFIFFNKKNLNNKVYKKFYESIFNKVIDFEYVDYIKSLNIMDKYTYVENKNKKISKKQINIFINIYKFFINIYNTKEVKYFDKIFINIILNDKLIGNFFMNTFIIYKKNKNKLIINKKYSLPKKNIEELKKLKLKNKIKDIIKFN